MYKALLLCIGLCACSLQTAPIIDAGSYQFTAADKAFLSQFSLNTLPGLTDDPSNAVANNLAAAQLGKQLFFDTRLSANKKTACASCHQPDKYFTDGLPVSKAMGTTRRSAPSVLGAAWSPWLFWDGRKDSLWSQALGPIEHPDEHGFSRTELAAAIARYYPQQYKKVFGVTLDKTLFDSAQQSASPLGDNHSQQRWQSLPSQKQQSINRIFSNAGKALMAYQRRLILPPAKFDHFIDAISQGDVARSKNIFNKDEVKGLRLFMGKANCASCHNGPLFTNFEFHNVGAPEADKTHVDMGRYEGVAALSKDEFTCLSEWSDADSRQCQEMLFLKRKGPELVGAFKTPSLRNIAATAPYMQAGQFDTLDDVLNHYNTPKPPYYDRTQHPNRPHFDILPLQLSEQEIQQIILFLNTLTSPIPKNNFWWK